MILSLQDYYDFTANCKFLTVSRVFPALHGMQTRSSGENSVRLSVSLPHA